MSAVDGDRLVIDGPDPDVRLRLDGADVHGQPWCYVVVVPVGDMPLVLEFLGLDVNGVPVARVPFSIDSPWWRSPLDRREPW